MNLFENTIMMTSYLQDNLTNMIGTNLSNSSLSGGSISSMSNYSELLSDEPGDEFMDYGEFDYSQREYPGEIRTYPIWEMVLKISFYVPVIVMALFGNLLVILVVARNKRMKTTTNYYIVNLAVADLLVVLTCSWVHLLDDLTEGWILGAFFCKFNTFAQVLSLVASIFTLTFIACDRFFGIVFAMKAHFIERRARYTILALWMCSLAVAAPLLVYRDLYEVQWKNHLERWCDDHWPVVSWFDSTTNQTHIAIPARKAYYTLVCVVLFFLPCTVMTIAYAVIIWTLWASRAPGERTTKDMKVQSKLKKKVIVMLVLILAIFVVCWLPLVSILLYTEYREDKNTRLKEWFINFQYFARYLAHTNSAVNPLIYAGFNDNFRKVTYCYYSSKSGRLCRYHGASTKCTTNISETSQLGGSRRSTFEIKRTSRISESIQMDGQKEAFQNHGVQSRFVSKFHKYNEGMTSYC